MSQTIAKATNMQCTCFH